MDRDLRNALFNAIDAYAKENELGYTAAGTALGLPAYQMTRWFSTNSKSYTGWTNPKPHILERLVLADVDPISSIALALLQGDRALPDDFDFTRASVAFGFNIGLPVALASALMGKARPADLIRTAAFDLVSAFTNTQYFTELAASSLDGYHSIPVHPFGMVKLSDPDDRSWPPTIGRPLLDWTFGDEEMQKQLLTVDGLLSAAGRESNELFNTLERLLKVPKQSMASDGDISLAVISANSASAIRHTTSSMAKVFRDAADQQPALARSPLYRIACRIFEINELTSLYSMSVTDHVFRYANSVLGEESVDRLIKDPNQQLVPMVRPSGGGFTTSCVNSRTYASPLPQLPAGQVRFNGDSYLISDRDQIRGKVPKAGHSDITQGVEKWR